MNTKSYIKDLSHTYKCVMNVDKSFLKHSPFPNDRSACRFQMTDGTLRQTFSNCFDVRTYAVRYLIEGIKVVLPNMD